MTDAIEVRRSAIISSIFAMFEDHVAKYTTAVLEGQNVCSVVQLDGAVNTCDQLQTEALLRRLTVIGFYPAQRDSDNRSIDEIIAGFKVISESKAVGVGKDHAGCCALGIIEEDIRDFVDETEGLQLSDFQRS